MDQTDINAIWQNFVDTITNHYMDFSGRVGRARFWYFVLAYAVVDIIISIVGHIVGLGSSLSTLFGLALFLPGVGITARRLQDTDRPGTWAWLILAPVGLSLLWTVFWIFTFATLGLGALLWPVIKLVELAAAVAMLALIYFCAQPGTEGSNNYGPPPPAWTPKTTPKPVG
jgi:uncharacterized membrane protein YhaH (DUF805 family)